MLIIDEGDFRFSDERAENVKILNKGGPPPCQASACHCKRRKGGAAMLHAGLDLSRTRLDFDLRDADGVLVEAGATTPATAGLAALVQRAARYR